MLGHPYRREAGFALLAVSAGAEIARTVQLQRAGERALKADRSPVTLADYAVQALVARLLLQRFPHDPLVAEEEPGEAGDLEALASFLKPVLPEVTPPQIPQWIARGAGPPNGRFWTLDPVDGTKGFLRGEQYAVALALVEDGQVVLGALGCPNLNQQAEVDLGGAGARALAVRGAGAWIEPLRGGPARRLQVSNLAEPSEARLLRSAAAEHTNLPQLDEIRQRLGVQPEPVLMDSQAKYLVLAAGRAELIYRLLSRDRPNYREHIWDQAAGSLLVQEAGGQVTDLDGRPLDFSAGRRLTRNRGVLVSNGRLHAAALQALMEERS